MISSNIQEEKTIAQTNTQATYKSDTSQDYIDKIIAKQKEIVNLQKIEEDAKKGEILILQKLQDSLESLFDSDIIETLTHMREIDTQEGISCRFILESKGEKCELESSAPNKEYVFNLSNGSQYKMNNTKRSKHLECLIHTLSALNAYSMGLRESLTSLNIEKTKGLNEILKKVSELLKANREMFKEGGLFGYKFILLAYPNISRDFELYSRNIVQSIEKYV